MLRLPARSRAGQLVPAILLAGYIAVFIWGAIDPFDRATWWVENVPIVGVVAALVVLYVRGVRFSPLAYLLMAVLPYWHTVGGHYTFERVPFGWFNRAFGFERNMFDRVGHFSVGLFAFGIMEYLVGREAMSRRLACLFAVFAIAFVAMSYELIEWGYAAYGGNPEAGAAFLGSQGDIWDAQKDMLMDTLGAVAAVLLFLATRLRWGTFAAWPTRPDTPVPTHSPRHSPSASSPGAAASPPRRSASTRSAG